VLALVVGLACFGINLHWARGQEKPPAPPATPAEAEQIKKHEAEERKAAERKGGTTQNYVFLRSYSTGVKVDMAGAAILHRAGVEYPPAAIEKRIEGTVVVEATLDASGNVGDARVQSGPPELRKAALQSVLQWHFVPEAAGSTRVVSLDFHLPAPGEQIAVAYESRMREGSGRERISELEKQIAELRQTYGDNHPKVAERMRELEEWRAKVAAERPADRQVVQAIKVEGLTDQVRADLMARLPVQVGATVGHADVERLAAAVRQFDEHLDVRVVSTGAEQCEIRIAPRSNTEFFRTEGPVRK
jgi:TonB family protein